MRFLPLIQCDFWGGMMLADGNHRHAALLQSRSPGPAGEAGGDTYWVLTLRLLP